ncbi:MAG: hypothetical protein AAB948_03205 [Patescibacteria group bacterium]
MQRINKTLYANIRKYKIEDKVKANELLKLWDKVIADFMPHAVKQTMAISYEKGVLKIAALSKDIAYQIHLYQKRLIQMLNDLLGKRMVFKIVCEA